MREIIDNINSKFLNTKGKRISALVITCALVAFISMYLIVGNKPSSPIADIGNGNEVGSVEKPTSGNSKGDDVTTSNDDGDVLDKDTESNEGTSDTDAVVDSGTDNSVSSGNKGNGSSNAGSSSNGGNSNGSTNKPNPKPSPQPPANGGGDGGQPSKPNKPHVPVKTTEKSNTCTVIKQGHHTIYDDELYPTQGMTQPGRDGSLCVETTLHLEDGKVVNTTKRETSRVDAIDTVTYVGTKVVEDTYLFIGDVSAFFTTEAAADAYGASMLAKDDVRRVGVSASPSYTKQGKAVWTVEVYGFEGGHHIYRGGMDGTHVYKVVNGRYYIK